MDALCSEKRRRRKRWLLTHECRERERSETIYILFTFFFSHKKIHNSDPCLHSLAEMPFFPLNFSSMYTFSTTRFFIISLLFLFVLYTHIHIRYTYGLTRAHITRFGRLSRRKCPCGRTESSLFFFASLLYDFSRANVVRPKTNTFA